MTWTLTNWCILGHIEVNSEYMIWRHKKCNWHPFVFLCINYSGKFRFPIVCTLWIFVSRFSPWKNSASSNKQTNKSPLVISYGYTLQLFGYFLFMSVFSSLLWASNSISVSLVSSLCCTAREFNEAVLFQIQLEIKILYCCTLYSTVKNTQNHNYLQRSHTHDNILLKHVN